MRGKSPISMPSNIQPRKAAASTAARRVLLGGAGDEREEAHFHAVEHPAEEGGDEDGGEALFIGRCDGGIGGGMLHGDGG
jgi:hypothetical protein